MQTVITALVLLLFAGTAHADDWIKITFDSGECIGCSIERSEIYISRQTGPGPTEIGLDNFFSRIGEALQASGMPPSLDLGLPIHADMIHLSIQLKDKHYSLDSGYENGSIPAFIGESSVMRRRRQAIEQMVEQAEGYLAERWTIKPIAH